MITCCLQLLYHMSISLILLTISSLHSGHWDTRSEHFTQQHTWPQFRNITSDWNRKQANTVQPVLKTSKYSSTCVKDYLWIKITCLQRPLQIPPNMNCYINYLWIVATSKKRPPVHQDHFGLHQNEILYNLTCKWIKTTSFWPDHICLYERKTTVEWTRIDFLERTPTCN